MANTDPADFQARLAANDPDVGNDIFGKYWPDMYRAAVGVFGSRSRQERSKSAEDAVQAACLEVHQKGLLNANVSNIRGLLITIATRRALDMVKKQKTKVEGVEELDGLAGTSCEAQEQLDDVISRVAGQQVLLAAIDSAASFSDNERRVLHGYYRAGKPVKEIAEELTLSETAVRKIIDRIIPKLQKDLGIRPGR